MDYNNRNDRYTDSFERRSALNKKIFLEKVAVQNRKTKLIKEVSGVLAVIMIAGGTVSAVKAMVDDYSRKKHDNTKSATDQLDATLPTVEAASRLEQGIQTVTDKKENLNKEKEIVEKATEAPEEQLFEVATNGEEEVTEYLNSYRGNAIHKYSSCYGVDPNLVAAICAQESDLDHEDHTPGGDYYNGYGVGAMQLESPSGQKITAYNYTTGTEDVIYETMDNACDEETNIKIGCMKLQNYIKHYDGDLVHTIQAYNYGQGMVDLLLNRMRKDNVDTNDYDMFLKYVKDVHENPSKYLNNWGENHYGDGDYIKHVLSHCPTKKVTCQNGNKTFTVDLETMVLSDQNSKTR